MEKDMFKCPKCGAEFERDKHYIAILGAQNFVQLMMGNDEIKDMCGKCNYFDYKNEESE